MKNTNFLFFAMFLIVFTLPSIMSINLDVEKLSTGEVMIADLNKPAQFDLNVKNLGSSGNFEFYNLLGFKMFPIGTTYIASGETKKINLEIIPIGQIKERGHYTLTYFIRGQDGAEQTEQITFEIIDFKDAFEVGSGNIEPATGNLEIYIHNKKNFNFGNLTVEFSSAFFNFKESFSLDANERKNFDITLNNEDFKKLLAGFYTLDAEITSEGKTTNVEGTIKFVEKDNVITTSKSGGFIIVTDSIKKTNEGNLVAETTTVIRRNILSRLFTTITPEPDSVDRQGFSVYYTWNRSLKPGDILDIMVRTNWLFPLLVIVLIVAIVLLTKQYSGTNLILKKRINFVKAKGGEFALKVSVIVTARKFVERVNVIERLPALVKLYERFGGETPTRVDEKNKKIEWNFERLEAGESRMISYIIYSKVGVLGRFALPRTTAVYEKDGEINEAESNIAYFVAEPRKQED